MRTLDEWIGKTDDEPAPARVKLRRFDAYHGRCYITGKKLMPGEFDLDHIIAIANGGENRESNLAPVWRPAHKEKTKDDMALKSKIARVRKKHLGIYPKTRNPIRSRGFQKSRPQQADPDT